MTTIAGIGNLIQDQSQITQTTNAMHLDVMSSIKSFYDELSTMLKDFADPTSTLTINGTEYDADQKLTSGVQLLMTNRLEEIQNIQGSLINIINIMFQLDKSAGQIGGGG
ncbi:MAG: hypothetical protein NT099_00460 [Candidatus Saganbacteria bacterium]|nr:hypothetical protein [Candidatus Saganbacteria bacterium]